MKRNWINAVQWTRIKFIWKRLKLSIRYERNEMAQNTRNSDLSQIAVNANNIPDGGCRRRAWFTFLSCAINSFLPSPFLQTVSTAALSDWAGAVAQLARNMPDCAPSLWCSSPPVSCRALANYTSGSRPSRPPSSSATTPWLWVSKLQPCNPFHLSQKCLWVSASTRRNERMGLRFSR